MVGLVALFWSSAFALGYQEIDPPVPPANIPLAPKEYTREYPEFELSIRYELKFDSCRWASCEELTCGRACKGGVHFRHEDCDSKCDIVCRVKHTKQFSARPVYQIDKQFQPNLYRALDALACPDSDHWRVNKYSPDLSLSFFPYLDQLEAIPRFNMSVSYQHWCNTPCTTQARLYARTIYKVIGTWQLSRRTTGPDGKPKTEKSNPVATEMGYVYLDDATTAKVDMPTPYCRCKVVVGESEAEYMRIKQAEEEEKKKQDEERVRSARPKLLNQPGAMISSTNLYLGPRDLEKLQFKIVCQDLSTAACTATNPYEQPLEFCIEPGTLCIPDDEKYQRMIVCSRVRLKLPPKEPAMFFVSLTPMPADAAPEYRGAIACTEMQKDPPNPSVAYSLDATTDPKLVSLSRIAGQGAIGSIWDQARFWIYTDRATLPQLQKRLLPAPSGGVYIKLLFEVASLGGVDFGDPAYRPCVDPTLLYSTGESSSDATIWFVRKSIELDPEAIATLVASHLTEFAALAAPGAPETNLQRLADVGSTMSQSKIESVALAGLRLLASGVPEEACAKVAIKGGLLGAMKVLSHPNSEVQKQVLKVLERYRYLPAYPEIVALAKASQNREVKELASGVVAKFASKE